jgi:uncharacterized coiled-coil DUF342 family protein
LTGKSSPSPSRKRVDSRTLEGEVDSGKLKLVDEKKNLKRISDLKLLKKQLSSFTAIDESIKSDLAKRKKLQDELNSSTSTPEAKALSEEYTKIKLALTDLREENDSAYAKRGELRSQRDETQKERDAMYEKKKALQDEYFSQLKAHREWVDQSRKVSSQASRGLM